MTDKFDTALGMLFLFEGYSSDVQGDPGKLTIWGVSEKSFPDDVAKMVDMTPTEAKEYAKVFYKREFWGKLGCDNLQTPLDIIAFDTGVNCGLHTANKFLAETRDWKDFLFKRMFYYSMIVQDKPEKSKFLRGWVNRCLSLWLKFKAEVA